MAELGERALVSLGPALVVAAAGESRRMGRPKAFLELKGRPFLLHILSAAAAAGARLALVVVADEPSAQRASALVGRQAEVAINPRWRHGMLTSYQVGARAALGAGASGLLLWPVDHPCIQPATVRRLWAQGDRLAVPSHGGRTGHPLWVPARCLEGLLALPETSSARELLGGGAAAGPGPTRVEVADPGVLIDVDTPADYADLVQGRLLPGP